MSGEIALTIDDDEGGDELHTLRDWLESDEDLRLVVVAVEVAEIQPEHMGFLTDALTLGLPNAIAADEQHLQPPVPSGRSPTACGRTTGDLIIECSRQ